MSKAPLKVGVLGGLGFIGRSLVDRLKFSGATVRVGDTRQEALSGKDVEVVRCDVRASADVRSFVAGLDVVLNLAAEHRDDVRPLSRYQQVNVEGAQNLCVASSEAGVSRLIFTSSVAVYGLSAGVATERSPCEPFNEYGRTKLAAENVLREWAAGGHGRRLTIVRPTVVFGEGNRGNVYTLMRQLHTRRFAMIGNGQNKKSMAYVENVADFLAHLAITGRDVPLVNYSDGPDVTTEELVTAIRSELGIVGKILRVPYPLGLAAGYACDAVARMSGRPLPISAVRVRKFVASTRVESQVLPTLGFTPRFSLMEGLRKVATAEFSGGRRSVSMGAS